VFLAPVGDRFTEPANHSLAGPILVTPAPLLVSVKPYRISVYFLLGAQMAKSLRSGRHKALTSVLRATRMEKGLTGRELSQKLRHAPNYVTKIETGERRLDVVEFFEIAQALGVDPVTLFTRVARW
jgi:Helix-turn-helix